MNNVRWLSFYVRTLQHSAEAIYVLVKKLFECFAVLTDKDKLHGGSK